MEIVCDTCGVKLNIPDEKIPPDRRVSIKCPKCSNKVVIDPSPRKAEEEMPEGSDPSDVSPAVDDVYASPDMDDTGLEFYGEDEKLALVLDHDEQHQTMIQQVLSDLGYRHLVEEAATRAIKRMHLYAFDLVFLSDGFDNAAVAQSPVMRYINRLSMSVRRRMFLILMGQNFKTMDRITAFALSANLVLNNKDMDNLGRILGNAVSDHEKFYKVFMDTLKELGKT